MLPVLRPSLDGRKNIGNYRNGNPIGLVTVHSLVHRN
uniref:Uncharacterized protein n=1 Tax=Arundo donax TaxID=35708 RepID=A0A0A9FG50_ARUDO